MATTPPAKRSTELRRTNTFPTEMATRSLEDAFQKERGAQSAHKKPSGNRLSDEFDDSDGEGRSYQEYIGKPPKNLRRNMFYFSSAFLSIAACVGTVPNVVSLWSLHLKDFIWDAPTMSTRSRDDQRLLFRSPHDDKVTDISQSTELTRISPRRPKLVIHMGPHKTASTTLQADLTLYQDRLQLDNYLYLGRLYHPFTRDGKFFVNRTPDSKLQTYFRDMFAKCWRGRYVAANKVLCVTELRDALLKTYGSHSGTSLPNLLISDEALLKLYHDDDTNTTTVNEHYVMLARILSRDWDIVLTVAYRRFFEWLPSAKYQKDKPNGRRQSTAWPNADPNVRVFSETGGGIPPQPLFAVRSSGDEDDVTQKFAEWRHDHFMSERTISTIRNITTSMAFSNTSEATIQLRIYHLYGKLSIRTHFLCKVLPHANNACKASRRDEILPRSEIRINARSDDTVSCPLSYFDALAIAAASPSLALIDTTVWKRQKVANLLRKHYIAVTLAWHEEEINRKMMASLTESDDGSLDDERTALDDDDGATSNNGHNTVEGSAPNIEPTNPWELPLKCPTSSQLEQLLHLSLSLEARHLPKLYRKAADEHRASFYKAVAESPTDYCWVDTDFLLSRDSLWKDHISKVFSAP